MLHSLSSRRAEKAENLNSRVMALQREVTSAEEKLKLSPDRLQAIPM
jgi:hypothetical protein